MESRTRSATSWWARNAPDCHSIASTSVVLPWSTCATKATLRRSERVATSRAHCRQPVDRRGVVVRLVRRDRVLALALGPARQQVTLTGQVEQRYAVAARVGDACQLDDDDRAAAGQRREPDRQLRPFRVIAQHDPAAPIEPDDARR